ncbi:MAG: response regulator [Deltaproteobacteria bacterium]|nr:response regulator [Deltaproteobacteria bacterium]
MKKILIVDDERPFLESLQDGIATYSDQLNVICANNGQEALAVLKKEKIDLLVTDLHMPVMDGFELLAHVSKQDPYLPVIVMTAFGTPEIEEKISNMMAFHYLEKPLDFDALTQKIEQALSDNSRSFIRGITLPAFLQMVHLEKKSCTLKVSSKDKSGFLFIEKGDLYDAQTSNLQGEKAAMEIMVWEDADIEMDNVCRRSEKKIEKPLDFVLLEAFRIKDEENAPEFQAKSKSAPEPALDPSFEPPAKTAKADATVGKSTPPPKPPFAEKLLVNLKKSVAIREFAIFDEANFLQHQSSDACSLAKVDPAFYLTQCQTLGKSLEGNKFRYIQFTTASRNSKLLFKRGKCQVVLSLNKGVKLNEILDQMSNSLFETS